MSTDTILIAFYVVTALNVLISAGFAVAGVSRPEMVAPGPVTESSRNFALYAAARAVPLALVVLAAIVLHATEAVYWLGLLAGIVQLGDAGIGLSQRDTAKTIGPFVIAVLQFGVVVLLQSNGVV